MVSVTLDRSAGQVIEQTSAANYWRDLGILSLIFIAACWLFFTGLGDFPLFNPDECFYAEPAREMLDTGNFITTTLNYAVRYTKPPLFIWATALSYHLFGQNEFAARFVAAAAGAVLVACTYRMLNRYTNWRAGVIGSVSLMTAPLYAASSRLGIADVPLSLLITGGLFCFFRGFREQSRGFIWLSYCLFGLAVMTKGPVGAVLPALILLVYHGLRRNLKEALRFSKPHFGALIIAAIALPWFIIETIQTGGEYFTCFIVMENFQRFTRVVSGHKGAWWYHFAVIAGGLLPWSIFLPQALLRAFCPSHHQEENSKWWDRFKHLDRKDDLSVFAACLAIVTVLFYSASTSKLLGYTLPAFPALAILIGIELDHWLGQSQLKKLAVPFAVLATIGGAALVARPLLLPYFYHAPKSIPPVISSFLIIQFGATLVAVILILLKRKSLALIMFGSMTFSTLAYFGYQITAAVSDKWEGPVPGFARFAALSKELIFIYKVRLPSVPFYTHGATVLSPAQERPIPGTNRYTGVAGESDPPALAIFPRTLQYHHTPESDATFDAIVPNMDRAYVIAKVDDRDFFRSHRGYKILVQDGQYILVHWTKPDRRN